MTTIEMVQEPWHYVPTDPEVDLANYETLLDSSVVVLARHTTNNTYAVYVGGKKWVAGAESFTDALELFAHVQRLVLDAFRIRKSINE